MDLFHQSPVPEGADPLNVINYQNLFDETTSIMQIRQSLCSASVV